MNKDNRIILCEGETDQLLLGKYLESVSGWRFFHNKKSLFPKERISWYKKSERGNLGIWAVGGNNFLNAMEMIIERETLEPSIDNLAVITDHDDDEAETERLRGLPELWSHHFPNERSVIDERPNRWMEWKYCDKFHQEHHIHLLYLLVPLEQHGALETFMLDSLLERSEEKKQVIDQSREFVNHFKSDVYLRQRRDRIKAELGVSLSVFSPDKVFTTMNELINEVNWGEFEQADRQFEMLKQI